MSTASEVRLSSADAAWLRMDRPDNLMVINSVLRFDGRLGLDQLLEVVGARLVGRYPRFSERVVESGALGPHWEPDPEFDIARHVRVDSLPPGRGERRLRELVGALAAVPLDRHRPLWEMHLVDGPGRGSTVIVRMHHCIADGIALARVMLSLTDTAPERQPASETRPAAPAPGRSALGPLAGPIGAAGAAARIGAGLAAGAARELGETIAHPERLLDLTAAVAADGRALSKLVFLPADARTVLKGELGTERSVAWSRSFPLEQIKEIAHAQEATVNDVLLAAVTGALRGYLLSRGQTPGELRAIVPFNLRPLEQPVPVTSATASDSSS